MHHDSGSVRRKLILMAVSTTLAALLSAAVAMLLYDLRTFQRYWVDDLKTQADIIARVTAPALAFNDVKSANQNLAVLRVRPQILSAAIYTPAGARFAAYSQDAAGAVGGQDGVCAQPHCCATPHPWCLMGWILCKSTLTQQ